MKIVSAVLLILSVSGSAFASNQGSINALESKLGGKALACRSVKHEKVDPAYRGDSGHFSVSVDKNQVLISDNGGDGYGFASGEIDTVAMIGSRLLLVVGDDGRQSLLADLDNIGADSEVGDKCLKATLQSEPDINVISSRTLKCCLQ